ncbi:MAG: XRE family transcriptional regulator [Planctomycetota bacterium]
MKRNVKVTDDALAIMDREFYHGKPERISALEKAVADDTVARKIYALRSKAGLSQRELAKLVGTTASVICRLESADYDGHSLAMLNRIAAALNQRVEIRFAPVRAAKATASCAMV